MSQSINTKQRGSSGDVSGCQKGERASTAPCWFKLKTENLALTDDPGKCIHHERSRGSLSSDAFALIRRDESLSSPLFFPPFMKRCHFLPSVIAVMLSHPETNPGNNRD